MALVKVTILQKKLRMKKDADYRMQILGKLKLEGFPQKILSN